MNTDRKIFESWPGAEFLARAWQQGDPDPFIPRIPEQWKLVTIVRRDESKHVYLAPDHVRLPDVTNKDGIVQLMAMNIGKLMVDGLLIKAD